MALRALASVLSVALMASAPAGAATYLLDNGRQHIGDGLFAPWSADGKRLSQPTIGSKYAVAFCLTKPSRLQVVMAQVLGIEEAKAEGEWISVPLSLGLALPYVLAKENCCGAALALRPLVKDGLGAPIALSRLRPEHNHRGFRSAWSPRLADGPYLLTIESQPIPWTVPGDLDDLEFIGLGVATKEPAAAVLPMGRALIYRHRVPLDAIPPSPCPP